MKTVTKALLFTALCLTASAQSFTNPKYVLSSGISFDAVQQATSSVSTLAVQVANIAGLPTYQATTLETAIVRSTTGSLQLGSTGTLRVGVCQTVYQSGNVSLGGCTDIGLMKAGDTNTLGTVTGSPYLAYDIGARVTHGKAHVYLIPAIRWIAISGVQVQPSYSLRIGTGF